MQAMRGSYFRTHLRPKFTLLTADHSSIGSPRMIVTRHRLSLRKGLSSLCSCLGCRRSNNAVRESVKRRRESHNEESTPTKRYVPPAICQRFLYELNANIDVPIAVITILRSLRKDSSLCLRQSLEIKGNNELVLRLWPRPTTPKKATRTPIIGAKVPLSQRTSMTGKNALILHLCHGPRPLSTSPQRMLRTKTEAVLLRASQPPVARPSWISNILICLHRM